MEIVIKEIRITSGTFEGMTSEQDLYYACLEIRPSFNSTFGMFFTKDAVGFDNFSTFVNIIKREFGVDKIDISFSKDFFYLCSENDLYTLTHPPF